MLSKKRIVKENTNRTRETTPEPRQSPNIGDSHQGQNSFLGLLSLIVQEAIIEDLDTFNSLRNSLDKIEYDIEL